MIYWDLFLGFLKVGCFTFGGAYSAIPLIRDVVRSYGWLRIDTALGWYLPILTQFLHDDKLLNDAVCTATFTGRR